MNVVIYARFSSHSQTEQSIEGQLKVCNEYAAANNYVVVGEYIDRAQSGTTDNRTEFQRMIADSDRHTFEGVLVYQLDRFARNRYDSAINKAKLKKNGVRVLSAKENISDDASGILVEGVLESMAEYYSVELSQKIHRGMQINAQKCLSNGSNPGLGYKHQVACRRSSMTACLSGCRIFSTETKLLLPVPEVSRNTSLPPNCSVVIAKK